MILDILCGLWFVLRVVIVVLALCAMVREMYAE